MAQFKEETTMKFKYNPNRMYQGKLLDPETPAWMEVACLILMGTFMGLMFAYGLLYT